MTSGTHWATANLVSITPDEEAASQELGFVTVTAEGGAYSGELPQCKLPRNVKQCRLEKVLAVKVTERGTGKR